MSDPQQPAAGSTGGSNPELDADVAIEEPGAVSPEAGTAADDAGATAGGPGAAADVPPPSRWHTTLHQIATGNAIISVLAVVLALLVGAIMIAFTDERVQAASGYFFARPGDTLGAIWESVAGAYSALFQGSVYNFRRPDFISGIRPLTETLTFATPLIAGGLGVGLAFRVGMFNIGGRGQMLIAASVAGSRRSCTAPISKWCSNGGVRRGMTTPLSRLSVYCGPSSARIVPALRPDSTTRCGVLVLMSSNAPSRRTFRSVGAIRLSDQFSATLCIRSSSIGRTSITPTNKRHANS